MRQRIHAMNKPDGFTPAIQRYAAVLPQTHVSSVHIGVQTRSDVEEQITMFLTETTELFSGPCGPDHFDFARFKDPQGYDTCIAVTYWSDPDARRAWGASPPVLDWWTDRAKASGPAGYFWEPFVASVDRVETIAFAEYIRGLAACPMSSIKPISESGYWGAARDRIAASAWDRFEPANADPLAAKNVESLGRLVVVDPPKNFCLIRSGVSWDACGDEQLSSYQANVLPRLDEGMDYLRSNPVEAGCWSLRQVEIIDGAGGPKNESYCAGHFASFGDLERWAHHHPTHLAIFGQAQKERARYQDDLELRTYHEVYIIDEPEPFTYVNCHNETGGLGFLPVTSAG